MPEEHAGSAGPDDWTVRASDLLQSTVESVRSKTVVPLTRLARILVFSFVLVVGALVAAVLFVVGLIRLIDSYLPLHPHARQVWVTYAGLGAIFVLAGAFFMRKRVAGPR
jgi:hypothetical protein